MRYIFSDLNAAAEYMDILAQSERYNATNANITQKRRDMAKVAAATWESAAHMLRHAVFDTK